MTAKVIQLNPRRRNPAADRPAPPTKPVRCRGDRVREAAGPVVRLRVAVRQVRAVGSAKTRHRGGVG